MGTVNRYDYGQEIKESEDYHHTPESKTRQVKPPWTEAKRERIIPEVSGSGLRLGTQVSGKWPQQPFQKLNNAFQQETKHFHTFNYVNRPIPFHLLIWQWN